MIEALAFFGASYMSLGLISWMMERHETRDLPYRMRPNWYDLFILMFFCPIFMLTDVLQRKDNR